jgi:hypothetical protein
MALVYLNHLTTFATIEERYNSVKPLGGKNHGGQDVRPIGDRKRAFERIIKISDDCYGLSDGWNFGDPIFGRQDHMGDPEFFLPIVWRRDADGTETIKIRNGDGPHSSQGRYAFLNRCLPRGLYFSLGQHGRQYITTGGDPTKHFLAKGTTVPASMIAARTAAKAEGKPYPYLDWATDVPDEASLIFKRGTGGWVLVSHGGKKEEPPRPRVVIDHDAKAALKTQIEAFRSWVHIIAPMMDVSGVRRKDEYSDVIAEWQRANGEQYPRVWGEFKTRVKPDLARAIVADPEHPLRVAMAAFAIGEAELKATCEDAEDVTALKGRFNRWINRVLAFNKKV